MSECRFILGSVTQAMKAKRILSMHSIAAEVVKLGNSPKSDGCVYAIQFFRAHKQNVVNLLQKENIHFIFSENDLS